MLCAPYSIPYNRCNSGPISAEDQPRCLPACNSASSSARSSSGTSSTSSTGPIVRAVSTRLPFSTCDQLAGVKPTRRAKPAESKPRCSRSSRSRNTSSQRATVGETGAMPGDATS
ncbi:Uncharacterised protein [Mycobacteroides abscessus subsp. abscessus]|nr:Uncharacterised protein [Mycobacteroides abscessus subsp. abscessus]